METPMSVLTSMPSTKDSLELFVSKTVDMVKSGIVNPIDLKCQLKFIEKAIDKIDQETKEDQLNEIYKHGKNDYIVNGFKVEKVEVAVKYDYEYCNDYEWNALNEKIQTLSILLKAREKFLKNITKPIGFVSEVTGGELITINPPLKASTTSVKLTMI